ncbi:MAG: glutathione S-transferase N-terminal domain-containing protein [Hyphomicrobiaceae bacterium]|nr:glutathione S-transferase N-terminal domain-containing protein [Hyphomicrobiaceae bacterium]
MKLLWSSRSPFVRKVMVAAHEVGLAGRIATQRVVVAADKPNAHVTALNPLNKIPTLVLDEGTVLYDSRVICEYLDTLHGGPRLIPSEPAARWTALRRQALGDGLMEFNVFRVTELRRSKEAQSEGHLAAIRLKTALVLDRLEAEGPDPVVQPDIGHIAIGCALSHLDFRFSADAWRGGRPRLSAWYAAFAERPSMRATKFVDVY